MASIPLPAADYLRQRLSYDENTGVSQVARWTGNSTDPKSNPALTPESGARKVQATESRNPA